MSAIPQTPRALEGGGGFAPWAPYQGPAYDPLGDIKRSPDPSPTHAPPPPTTIPGSAPDNIIQYNINILISKFVLYCNIIPPIMYCGRMKI